MPELAEVEFYRKQWLPILGQPVLEVRFHPRARVFRGTDLRALEKGLRTVTASQALAHGKQLYFVFPSQGWLGIHLGMSGALSWIPATETPAVDGPHDHLMIHTAAGSACFHDPRMFGCVSWHPGDTPPAAWRNRPPGLLEPAFTAARLREALQRHARAPIKAVLLRQEYCPGIGNWMADEILWRCGIHPALPAGLAVADVNRLWRAIRRVARDALCVIGTNWGTPPDRWLFNHRWQDGGRCPRTGCLLQRATIASRTTCWSPALQKLPRSAKPR
jgi:formamidopyrimidine-DNA glycosylase